MKKLFFVVFLAFLTALPLRALQCGAKAVELTNLKYLNGFRAPAPSPAEKNTLRVLTFIHTYDRSSSGTLRMLLTLEKLYPTRIRQTVITPDPESDAVKLLPLFKQSKTAFAVDSSRRLTMQYMAGSLLYPKSFVIDSKGNLIWCGETVDLSEMLQEFFAGTFDHSAAEKLCPLLNELQTLLRESSERKMKQLTDRIFAIAPAHAGALRMRLFALENSNRIPQAWELLNQCIKAAPGKTRVYFTALDFMSRFPYFQSAMGELLAGFERNIKDPDARCMMAWELLKRFQYNLTSLEYANTLLGSAPPALPRLRSAWFAARARVAYLAGDLPKAIAFQKQVAPANARGKDPVLEYFTGAEKLKKRLP